MRVQYCTSEVCPGFSVLTDFVIGHVLISCLKKVVLCNSVVVSPRVDQDVYLINLSNRCQLKTTADGGLGNTFPQPHQSESTAKNFECF